MTEAFLADPSPPPLASDNVSRASESRLVGDTRNRVEAALARYLGKLGVVRAYDESKHSRGSCCR